MVGLDHWDTHIVREMWVKLLVGGTKSSSRATPLGRSSGPPHESPC